MRAIASAAIFFMTVSNAFAATNFTCEMIKEKSAKALCIKDREARAITEAKSEEKNRLAAEEKYKADAEKFRISGLVKALQAELTKDFKDPASAQFTELVFSELLFPALCGKVNAKNSYGGYVGEKQFYIQKMDDFFDKKIIEQPKTKYDIPVHEVDVQLYNSICGKGKPFPVLSVSSRSNDKDSLLDGCSALNDLTKKAKCFEAIARMPSKQIDPPEHTKAVAKHEPLKKSEDEIESERTSALRKKFEAVNRAAVAIKSATTVGLNYNQYSPYIQQLATEIAIARQAASSSAEQSALSYFDRAVESYTDAMNFWGVWINFYAKKNNELAFFRGIPIDITGTRWVAEKYAIQIIDADLIGFNKGISKNVTLAAIWNRASAFVDEGNSELTKKVEIKTELPLIETPAKKWKEDADTAKTQAQRLMDGEYNEFISKSKNIIASKTSDPSSVQWRNLVIGGRSTKALCGEVNSKGALGVYTGFKHFSIDSTGFSLIEKTWDSSRTVEIIMEVCGDIVDKIE